eukprot:Gb_13672 [translate_table: standard]
MAPSKRTRQSTGAQPVPTENGSTAKKQKINADANGNGKVKETSSAKAKSGKVALNDRLLGSPLPKQEAQRRWPSRYDPKGPYYRLWSKGSTIVNGKWQVRMCYYVKINFFFPQGCYVRHLCKTALVRGRLASLLLKNEKKKDEYDLFVHPTAEEGAPDYIGRIVEFFETTDGKHYFTSRWFFRAEDTAIKNQAVFHDKKRVFYSDIKDDNLLECITSKINIVQVPPVVDAAASRKSIPPCDFYYDTGYSLPYSTFYNLPTDNAAASSDSTSTVCDEVAPAGTNGVSESKSDTEVSSMKSQAAKTVTLLDLYSGCGGMSTGLCFGANLSGVNLVTKWALDLNEAACKSLKHNHPETEVRNESADDFLTLLKEWQKLCKKYCDPEESKSSSRSSSRTPLKCEENKQEEESDNNDSDVSDEEYEVESLIGVRHVQPTEKKNSGLEFKVHWKGYDESEDSWEPIEGLGDCEERVKEFVRQSAKAKLLPLPGDVDVICGGPPCQGASGFNRFRNVEAPLDDPKNHQMVVYMDIVNFLRPRYVLMENVVDILKFAGGLLGRYALSRLVHMNYQAKLGMMAAGCYGLPQFRMRVFLWGASPSEACSVINFIVMKPRLKLPQYPLPTHDVVVRGGVPNEWERNMVAYDENQNPKLEKALVLGDAISDLPQIMNSEHRNEMPYGRLPRTEFQRYIRMPKEVMKGQVASPLNKKAAQKASLYDHRPLQLNEDDYQRVCRIPKRKGANFRDLPGVLIRADNTVELDTSVERVLLPSGKPLIPDYAISFVKGRSLKPFGRLWWDETVPTVVTRAEPHNQAILHPEQDRVLSIRENARLQGFPDYYKLYGNVKERYIQVGNAVAVPVARALGFALGMAMQSLCTDEPVMQLPYKFPHCFGNQQNGDITVDVGEKC